MTLISGRRFNAPTSGPIVRDPAADQRFRQLIRDLLRGDPDSVWHAGYVDHVWEKCREPLVQYLQKSQARRVLEFFDRNLADKPAGREGVALPVGQASPNGAATKDRSSQTVKV